MSADDDIDLEDVVAVNEWSVAKVVMVDEDGAAECVFIEMIDADSEQRHRFLLNTENGAWLGWAAMGSALGFLGQYASFSQGDVE